MEGDFIMQQTADIMCPVNQQKVILDIEYSNYPDFEQDIYVKGFYVCSLKKAGGCDIAHCPVYAAAPENL